MLILMSLINLSHFGAICHLKGFVYSQEFLKVVRSLPLALPVFTPMFMLVMSPMSLDVTPRMSLDVTTQVSDARVTRMQPFTCHYILTLSADFL